MPSDTVAVSLCLLLEWVDEIFLALWDPAPHYN